MNESVSKSNVHESCKNTKACKNGTRSLAPYELVLQILAHLRQSNFDLTRKRQREDEKKIDELADNVMKIIYTNQDFNEEEQNDVIINYLKHVP